MLLGQFIEGHRVIDDVVAKTLARDRIGRFMNHRAARFETGNIGAPRRRIECNQQIDVARAALIAFGRNADVNQVGNPSIFEGKTFFGATGIPKRKIAFVRTRFED